MRNLLKRDISHFVWSSKMQKGLDRNKPSVIKTDASLKGLVAIFLSKTQIHAGAK